MKVPRLHTVLVAVLVFLSACEDLERNNPLDPRNPRSERNRLILVEAFVNDGTPFSSHALKALDTLSSRTAPGQVVIVEHHLPHPNFADAYALAESRDRYHDLTATDLGVPDVFLNGTAVRVQGASNEANALLRYRNAIDAEAGKTAFFTIEAKKNVNGSALTVDVAIARLGSSDFGSFSVLAIAFEDLREAGHHRVTRKVFPRQNFSGLRAGERKNAQLAVSAIANAERLSVIVLVEQIGGTGREVLQVALAN